MFSVVVLWASLCSICCLLSMTGTVAVVKAAQHQQQHHQQQQSQKTFCSSAENKMFFNLTIIHHDLLLFAAYDANVSKKEFGAEAVISYEAAHSYVLLHDLLADMCVGARGGEVFRRVIFELDGYSCVGFLHEMFVASIIGGQHADAESFSVFADYATDAARVVLFQSRHNAYQHVMRGELDWRYLGGTEEGGTEEGEAATNRNDVHGDVAAAAAMKPEVIVGVPATAVLLVISEETLCAILTSSSSSPSALASDSLSTVLKEAILKATLYWDRLSLYIGYDACHAHSHAHSQCLAQVPGIGLSAEAIRERIESFVATSIPTKQLCSVHVEAYSLEEEEKEQEQEEQEEQKCYPKEVSRLLLFDQLTRTAFRHMDDDFHNYEYFFLLHDSPSGTANIPPPSSPSSTSVPAHVFSVLERDTPDTLIPRERSPFSVFVALAPSCVHSFVTLATCRHISHIRLPRSLLAVYGGHMLPPGAMKAALVKSLLLQVSETDAYSSSSSSSSPSSSSPSSFSSSSRPSSSSSPTTALSTLALYLQDMLRPFQDVTFFVAHLDRGDSSEMARTGGGVSVSALTTPPISYIQALVQTRTKLLHALQQQQSDFLDLRASPLSVPPNTGTGTGAMTGSHALSHSLSQTHNTSRLLLASEYHELKLLSNPTLVRYGPADIHYPSLCEVEDCEGVSASDVEGQPVLQTLLQPQDAPALISPPPFATPNPTAKIAFFTTILGDYETSCPKVIRQKHIVADFICFTNSPMIINATALDEDNHWIVDDYPYHLDRDIWSQIDHDSPMYVNSVFDHVMNPPDDDNGGEKVDYYNLVKFYKMNFFLFPRMKQYDYVVWLDGTIEIHADTAALVISEKLQAISAQGFHVMVFEHTRKSLLYEGRASAKDKRWAAPPAAAAAEEKARPRVPHTNIIMHQLQTYLQMGYNESHWQSISSASRHMSRPLYGLWVTCFLAYDMRDASTQQFLQSWYTHTQMFSSQCQMSFSFLAQRNRILSERAGVPFRPYSLPDGGGGGGGGGGGAIRGTNRVNSLFRKKRYHGSTTI